MFGLILMYAGPARLIQALPLGKFLVHKSISSKTYQWTKAAHPVARGRGVSSLCLQRNQNRNEVLCGQLMVCGRYVAFYILTHNVSGNSLVPPSTRHYLN